MLLTPLLKSLVVLVHWSNFGLMPFLLPPTTHTDVTKTFFQDQDLNFKTKTKTFNFFQDQDQA